MLNKITIDCLTLISLMLLILIIFGIYKEHGDSNAGSMYGLYILPAIPLIIISLSLITASKNWFKHQNGWLGSLTPLIFFLPVIWLNLIPVEILVTILMTIIIYTPFKSIVKKLFDVMF